MTLAILSIGLTFGWIVFCASTGLAIAVGIVLAYHWIRFSMNPIVPTFAFVVYIAGCGLLLSIMFGTLLVR